jgi:hypothetical protein
MMANWMKKLLFLVALAVLPLQGMAMATTFVACHEQTSAQQVSQMHQHDHQDGAAHHHDDPGNDGGGAGGSSGHLCGHQVVFHLPTFVNFVTTPGFPAWAAPASSDYTPHFPEQPRRPPRV